MKKCKCDDYKTCTAAKSCMYDFISVEHVPELGTLIIDDLLGNEKVVVCMEHVPQLILELQNKLKGDCDEMEQYLVMYNTDAEIVRCLFLTEQDAKNYAIYIEDIFGGEQKPTITKVKILPVR